MSRFRADGHAVLDTVNQRRLCVADTPSIAQAIARQSNSHEALVAALENLLPYAEMVAEGTRKNSVENNRVAAAIAALKLANNGV